MVQRCRKDPNSHSLIAKLHQFKRWCGIAFVAEDSRALLNRSTDTLPDGDHLAHRVGCRLSGIISGNRSSRRQRNRTNLQDGAVSLLSLKIRAPY
jgi:hypothetical protein